MGSVKAIPFYLSAQDCKNLLYQLKVICDNPNFGNDTLVVFGQLPLSLDLYLSVRYDGLEEESIIMVS